VTSPALVQLHVTTDYALGDRVFYRSEELLPHRRRTEAAFDALPPALEFACLLVNRVSKRNVREKDRAALEELFTRDRDGCILELRRFWLEQNVAVITPAVSGARDSSWQRVNASIGDLRADLFNHVAERPFARVARKLRQWGRRLARWCSPRPPCGLHVVFLGPDGVGKSTVIEGVTRALTPAFLRTDYFTFAPSILPRRNKPKTHDGAEARPADTGPHALPPRSYPASLLKAGWWFLCYTVGYLLTIHPAKARSSLVINHRYFVDAIVDRRRYRYSGPVWLLKLIWRFVPRPDLFILLDAPAEVIWPRKREVAFEETARQRQAYRDLIAHLPNAHVIDAAQSPDKVVADVNRIILDHLATRLARRIDSAGKSASPTARPASSGREVKAE
jgi:thymidylate kinase